MVSAPVIVSGSEAVSAGDDDDYDEALTSSFSMSTVTNNHKILMLAKSKLNSIETLISQALIGLEIRREDFKTIVKEKGKV